MEIDARLSDSRRLIGARCATGREVRLDFEHDGRGAADIDQIERLRLDSLFGAPDPDTLHLPVRAVIETIGDQHEARVAIHFEDLFPKGRDLRIGPEKCKIDHPRAGVAIERLVLIDGDTDQEQSDSLAVWRRRGKHILNLRRLARDPARRQIVVGVEFTDP